MTFRVWFLPGVITGGDLWYYFPSMFDNHQFYPSDWAFFSGNGFGGTAIPFMAVSFFMSIPFFFGKAFGISWEILQRVFILFPFLIAVSVFPYLFLKKLFPNNLFVVISSLIFSFNSYILMLVSGGLVVIGIAYCLIPLGFLFTIKILDHKGDKRQLISNIFSLGIIFGIQSVLDVRVTYMTFVGISIFFISRLLIEKNFLEFFKNAVSIFIVPLLIAGLINAFWLLPALTFGSNALDQLGENYTTVESVRFFSFAKFENTISLLHPNWPENIFGKTYFQRPEFLIFTFFAFISLLFVNKNNRKIVLPFVIMGVLASFLAKGSSDPFGGIYIFLFENIPGFVFFRDPTKWYMLIALSFSVLIPFSIFKLYSKYKKVGWLVPVFFAIYFLITILPALSGKLPGTFKTSNVPSEYVSFEEFMSQQDPGRILWVPSPSRFSYFSQVHPAVSGNKYFDMNDPSEVAQNLSSEAIDILGQRGVSYVAVPYDSRGEIFLKDRVYDEKEYIKTIEILDSNTELKRIDGLGNLRLYSIEDSDVSSVLPKENIGRPQTTNLAAAVSLVAFILSIITVIALKLKR